MDTYATLLFALLGAYSPAVLAYSAVTGQPIGKGARS